MSRLSKETDYINLKKCVIRIEIIKSPIIKTSKDVILF